MACTTLDKAIVLAAIKATGQQGANAQELTCATVSLDEAECAIRSLREGGWIYRVDAEDRYAVTPDHANSYMHT